MKNYSEISDKIHQYKLIERAVQLLLRQAHGIEAEKKETDKVIQGLNQWLYDCGNDAKFLTALIHHNWKNS
jgi:prefoldin subunit 5